MLLLPVILACASTEPEESPAEAEDQSTEPAGTQAAAAAPPARRIGELPPALQVDGPPILLPGLCEPSGAARAADGGILLVDDDLDGSVFAWSPGASPVRQAFPSVDVKDAEGLAVDDEGGLWVSGGLGRSRHKGKVGKRGAVARYVGGPEWTLDLATVDLRPGREPSALAPLMTAIYAACADCRLPSDASGMEEGHALDVEGLGWTHDGRLLFGLRAPLVAERAVVFATDPAALRARASLADVVTAAWALDLGGRGVRDLGPGTDGAMLLLAGAHSNRETPGGALYRWRPGSAVEPLGTMPRLGAPAEAIVADGPRAAWLFLDEGTRLSDGLRPRGPHAAEDENGRLELRCGAGRPTDWAHAVHVTW